MGETLKDRIVMVMESQHQTQKIFSQFIGVSEATLSSIIKERTRPTLNIVEAIKKKIPTISTDWLLFGKGEMYVDENRASSTPPTTGRTDNAEPMIDFGAPETAAETAAQTAPVIQRVIETPKNMVKTEIKYIDKPQRNITEIRVFYDDQTWETFVPKK